VRVLDDETRPRAEWWHHLEADNRVLLRELPPADAAGVLSVHGDARVYTLDPHETHRDLARAVLNVYFRFAPAVRGRGLAGLVLAEAVRMAPHVAPGVDIVVRTRPANAAARRAERAGFVDEGLEPGTTDMQLLRLPAPDVSAAPPGSATG
jgi:ribosomal-protein-alanine N-acetyltransferase